MSITSLEQCLACWRCFKNVMLSCNWERTLIQELGVSITCRVALESPPALGVSVSSSVSWTHWVRWPEMYLFSAAEMHVLFHACLIASLHSPSPNTHTHTHTHPTCIPVSLQNSLLLPLAFSVFHFLDQKKLHEVTNHCCPCSSAMTALVKQQ